MFTRKHVVRLLADGEKWRLIIHFLRHHSHLLHHSSSVLPVVTLYVCNSSGFLKDGYLALCLVPPWTDAVDVKKTDQGEFRGQSTNPLLKIIKNKQKGKEMNVNFSSVESLQMFCAHMRKRELIF